MYLKEYLKKYDNKKIKLFVDMDGVIADYIVGNPYNYHEKRPVVTSIEKLQEISKMENVELYILSASRLNEGIEQKNNWLDIHAPFFKKENRIILPREENDFVSSKILKANYFKDLERDESVLILIDDDPRILKEIKETCSDVVLLKDTVLVD